MRMGWLYACLLPRPPPLLTSPYAHSAPLSSLLLSLSSLGASLHPDHKSFIAVRDGKTRLAFVFLPPPFPRHPPHSSIFATCITARLRPRPSVISICRRHLVLPRHAHGKQVVIVSEWDRVNRVEKQTYRSVV